MKRFFERIYFQPKGFDYLFIAMLSPLSVVYGTVMLARRLLARKKCFGVPVISVGNLIVGGSGKTPFVIALASRYKDVTVISRGYGRQSSGLVKVSSKGKVLTDVRQSGDEAMLMALSLPNASVIVSENREKAIALAHKEGAKIIILDDGFNRVDIEKYDIVLKPSSMPNPLPFPAGPLREFAWSERFADAVLQEGSAFKRVVQIESGSKKLLLATAIANPSRLEPFLPRNVVGRYYLEDHAYFDAQILSKKMREVGADALLVTEKDAVKMAAFKLPLVQMRLKLEIDPSVLQSVDEYIKKYKDSNEA